MNEPELDAVIHAPLRLRICALLKPLAEVEFQMVRDELGVSDSVLSKHVKQLEQAGYVSQRKAPLNGRQRTWLALTRRGSAAFRLHLRALRELVAVAEAPDSSLGSETAERR